VKEIRDRFALPRQNQIRRDFAQRLKHEPPQVRERRDFIAPCIYKASMTDCCVAFE